MTDYENVMKFVALEMRARREEAGLSRAQAVKVIRKHTGLVIGDRTLLAWENNLRVLDMIRFLQVCDSYGASPLLTLAVGLRRAELSRCRECGR